MFEKFYLFIGFSFYLFLVEKYQIVTIIWVMFLKESIFYAHYVRSNHLALHKDLSYDLDYLMELFLSFSCILLLAVTTPLKTIRI